jgi:hypothetical protein
MSRAETAVRSASDNSAWMQPVMSCSSLQRVCWCDKVAAQRLHAQTRHRCSSQTVADCIVAQVDEELRSPFVKGKRRRGTQKRRRDATYLEEPAICRLYAQ